MGFSPFKLSLEGGPGLPDLAKKAWEEGPYPFHLTILDVWQSHIDWQPDKCKDIQLYNIYLLKMD